MKRDWFSYIDEAEARGDLEEARAFQTLPSGHQRLHLSLR
jgi:hypothetical protein